MTAGRFQRPSFAVAVAVVTVAITVPRRARARAHGTYPACQRPCPRQPTRVEELLRERDGRTRIARRRDHSSISPMMRDDAGGILRLRPCREIDAASPSERAAGRVVSGREQLRFAYARVLTVDRSIGPVVPDASVASRTGLFHVAAERHCYRRSVAPPSRHRRRRESARSLRHDLYRRYAGVPLSAPLIAVGWALPRLIIQRGPDGDSVINTARFPSRAKARPGGAEARGFFFFFFFLSDCSRSPIVSPG